MRSWSSLLPQHLCSKRGRCHPHMMRGLHGTRGRLLRIVLGQRPRPRHSNRRPQRRIGRQDHFRRFITRGQQPTPSHWYRHVHGPHLMQIQSSRLRQESTMARPCHQRTTQGQNLLIASERRLRREQLSSHPHRLRLSRPGRLQFGDR